MLLEELASHHNVRSAAVALAGNWKSWQCFVWFGSRDIPHSDKVALGYLINHEGGYEQLTNSRVVRLRMGPFWGDLSKDEGNIDKFSSSLCGDRNALNGVMIRVFDDKGRITEAFRKLYALARHMRDNSEKHQDPDIREIRKEELSREVRYWAGMLLPDMFKKRMIEETPERIEEVATCLIEDGDYDFDLTEGLFEQILDEIYGPEPDDEGEA